MDVPAQVLGGPVDNRRCLECGSILAADNTARLCGRCHKDQRDQLRAPLVHLKREFFETEAFDAAFDSQQIGRVFKAYRNHPRHLSLLGKALNQEVLGRWLGITQAKVSKLENGKDEEENIKTLRAYAETLGIPHDMLWFDFPGERRFKHIRSERADRSASLAIQGWREPSFEEIQGSIEEHSSDALVILTASESAKFGLRHQVTEIHSSTMEQIEEEVRRLSVDFIAGDPLDTFIRSRQLRNDIFGLLELRTYPKDEELLYGYAARTLGYLAAASSDFYGQYDAAADQCRTARKFADIAGFPELRAWVLSLQSGVAFWRGEWGQAAALAQNSLDLAITRSGVMRATSMRARALARLGDAEKLHVTISAYESSSIDGSSDEENGMVLFSEINHLRCIGTAYLWAGESRKAQEQLTRALSEYLTNSPENFAVIATIRADIASSFLDLRDLDGAAEALSPLLLVTPDQKLEGAIRRVRGMRSILSSQEFASSHIARSLTSQIDLFLQVPPVGAMEVAEQ